MNTKVTNIHLEKLSPHKIKFIKSLHLKKNRDAAQCLYLEGETFIKDLLNHFPALVKELIIDQDHELAWQDFSIPVFTGSSKDLERCSQLKTPKKLNAIVSFPTNIAWDGLGTVLLLDQIQDPGNLGSIIRTADWYGIQHIFCSPNTVDFLNPKVMHSTMISAFRVSMHYEELSSIIKDYQTKAFGAFMDGQDFERIQPQEVQLLVLGNEGRGISSELAALLPNKLTIPRIGAAESLNVGVATGILLQHFTKL
jgi:TrmH family RNA methyltransferase